MKKTVFSGMQPTGVGQLGNYLGAIKNWVSLQDEYNCLYSVVDLHAITIRQEPDVLRQNSLDLLAMFISCGLDPDKNIIYMQSHYHGHTELAWLLSCYAYFGELSRQAQYKDKSAKNAENVNVGLFSYPVLQAADILLFGTNFVPVGEDQKQHLELSRDIAIRFNNAYGETFAVPEPLIPKTAARVKSLSHPDKKMSKSDDAGSYISLLDPAETVMKKFKRAVTDSETEIRYDPENKPGISNLLEIYAVTNDMTIQAAASEFAGKNYGALKIATAEAVIGKITDPIQSKYFDLAKNVDYLYEIMRKNAARARDLGDKTLQNVKNKIGLIL
ncbi:MAG: tryptophan--tRNA ligase [Clostridiales bacterium]|jgi:tryptophanyl-tRNA synthetase|nr:tryptophan--tRNA ligase [Clostridiales bacterium]